MPRSALLRGGCKQWRRRDGLGRKEGAAGRLALLWMLCPCHYTCSLADWMYLGPFSFLAGTAWRTTSLWGLP